MNFITFKAAGRLLAVTALLALSAVLWVGCGGGDSVSSVGDGTGKIVIKNLSGKYIGGICYKPLSGYGEGSWAAGWNDGSKATLEKVDDGTWYIGISFEKYGNPCHDAKLFKTVTVSSGQTITLTVYKDRIE